MNIDEHLPYIFVTTPDNTLIGNGDEIRLPQRKHWRALDDIGDDATWETELAVVIGRNAKDVSPEEALDYVAGYTIYQDVSAEAIRAFGSNSRWTGSTPSRLILIHQWVPGSSRNALSLTRRILG